MPSVTRLTARSAILLAGFGLAGCNLASSNPVTEFTESDGVKLGACVAQELKLALFDTTVRSVTLTNEGKISDYTIAASIKPQFTDEQIFGGGQLRLEGSGFYSASGFLELNDSGERLYSSEQAVMQDRDVVRASLEKCLKATTINGLILAAN